MKNIMLLRDNAVKICSIELRRKWLYELCKIVSIMYASWIIVLYHVI